METDEDFTGVDFDHLILEGALYADGVDDDGEILYSWDSEKLKRVNPLLHARMQRIWAEEVDEALMGLAAKGLIDIEFDDHLEPTAVLTELGRRVYEIEEED